MRRRRSRPLARPLAAGLVLVAAGLPLSACSELEEESSEYEAATLTPVEGSDVVRVTFTDEGNHRIGLRTGTVDGDARRRFVPRDALIYSADGKTFVYTSSKPLSFLREEVTVERMDGARAVLSEGPPAGTRVVTTGAAEVYGAEFEVGH